MYRECLTVEDMKRIRVICSLAIFVFGNVHVIAEDAMPVSIVKAIRAPIAEEINLIGNLQAIQISLLTSEVEGHVSALSVDDGDRISKGQIVVELDNELATINTNIANASVDETQAIFSEAERRYAELTELAKKKHVPATSVETARSDINIAAARHAQSRATKSRADALLKRHTVRAPFDGVVNAKLIEIGQWVDTSDPLIELVATKFLRLRTPVPQSYYSRVGAGTPVVIRFDALPNELVESTITTKIPVTDTQARTFPVHIDLSNDHELLAPGMSARVLLQITDGHGATALIVPQDAIVRQPNGAQSVWTIVVDDGVATAVPKKVSTGRVYHNNVEILDGEIEPGTEVIVRGNEILRPGQRVRVSGELQIEF
jgi:membrane fusion protein (multidrug efflux system)